MIIPFPDPKILHPGFVARLAEANEAARQLRQLGCQIIRQTVGEKDDEPTEIIIDHNPHRGLRGCPNVHITCGGAR